MLKKTGIIVSAAAAGVLGLSSLAFATTSHHEAPAPVNHTNIADGNVTNDCEFGQAGPSVSQDLVGGNSVADVAGAVSGVVTPLTNQLQVGNCTNLNVSDVADLDSNNTTRTATSTETVDSNNTGG